MTDEPEQQDPWGRPADESPPQRPEQPPSYPPQPPQPQAQPYGQQQPPYGYGAPAQYPPPPAAPYGQSPASYGYPAPTGAYGPQAYYGPSTSGKATTVLVLGILSLVLALGCIGFILAIVALVMAPGATREIRESGGQLTGEGQIKAGKITSWITLAITGLAIAAAVVGLIVAVSTSNSSSDAPASTVRTNATSLVDSAGAMRF